MAWSIALNFDKCGNKVKVTGTDMGRRFYKSSKLLKRTFYCKLMSKNEAIRLLSNSAILDTLGEAMNDIGEMQSIAICVNDMMLRNRDYRETEEMLNGINTALDVVKEAIAAL